MCIKNRCWIINEENWIAEWEKKGEEEREKSEASRNQLQTSAEKLLKNSTNFFSYLFSCLFVYISLPFLPTPRLNGGENCSLIIKNASNHIFLFASRFCSSLNGLFRAARGLIMTGDLTTPASAKPRRAKTRRGAPQPAKWTRIINAIAVG